MYSNCFFYALKRWLQVGPSRSYLIIRKSRYTWAPHVMFTESISNVEIEEFKPIRPKRGLFWRLVPLHVISFRGRIRKGRGEEIMPPRNKLK